MRRPTQIKQRDITDCGAACLCSVAAYYRLRVPVSRIRQHAGTDQQGTNVLGMLQAAEKIGLRAKAAKGPAESLQKIPLPAIAHVVLPNQLHHYVVIYRVRGKKLCIMDPADGKLHRKTTERFNKEWTGVILLCIPGEDFTEGNQVQSNALRFWQLVKPHSGILLQALTGAVVYTLLGLSTSLYLQKIIDFVLTDGNTRLLNLLSALMLLLLGVQLYIGVFKTLLGLQTGQSIDAKLILGYYKHLLQLPQRFFDTMRVGEIISRVNDAVKIREFINDTALNMIVNCLMIVFSAACMFLYYWKLAALTLLIVPLYSLIYFIGNRIHKKWQRMLMESSAELETQFVESLTAAGTIKRFGLEQYAGTRTEKKFADLLDRIRQSSTKGIYLNTSTEFCTRLFTILLLWAGSYFVISRELSPGELLSFYALLGYLTAPLGSLLSANKNIQEALIAADRLFEIIDLETEASPAAQLVLSAGLVGDIHFSAVCFRYGSRTNVFENFTATIQKGKATAIVGESGSGKSTLLSLLQNLYPLQKGHIRIGDADIRYIDKQSLRKLVSVVPQHIELFSGSIAENIAIGDEQMDMSRILQLARLLGIDDFANDLPAGYHTLLHEQGVNLSGGQRQRIAIARALYRNPEILILDEATSSLDPFSEQKVQETLRWFASSGKTIIVIAHRLSTIRNCDTILVLKQGKLIEEGDHEKLLATGGEYHALWQHHAGLVNG
ncbi:peptidase domain-containing ABC transporter [Sediminibacterium soli]|uniref:peptidase domain-containing ABC transporter n=1 Tax=Sediminibacterium soli TaxID=2698829 RepID=UPI001379BF45|nr:peptidase domain-containing ABC transporter [Sediminibacterium soli]NCI47054.1 peptidase domain-containing ABC transporter [Sediminibacterium soli]